MRSPRRARRASVTCRETGPVPILNVKVVISNPSGPVLPVVADDRRNCRMFATCAAKLTTADEPIDDARAGRVVVATVHLWARFDARTGAPEVPRPDRFLLSCTRQETASVNTDVALARAHQTHTSHSTKITAWQAFSSTTDSRLSTRSSTAARVERQQLADRALARPNTEPREGCLMP
jgi:hypothetical protein